MGERALFYVEGCATISMRCRIQGGQPTNPRDDIGSLFLCLCFLQYTGKSTMPAIGDQYEDRGLKVEIIDRMQGVCYSVFVSLGRRKALLQTDGQLLLCPPGPGAEGGMRMGELWRFLLRVLVCLVIMACILTLHAC